MEQKIWEREMHQGRAIHSIASKTFAVLEADGTGITLQGRDLTS